MMKVYVVTQYECEGDPHEFVVVCGASEDARAFALKYFEKINDADPNKEIDLNQVKTGWVITFADDSQTWTVEVKEETVK
jgi:hypothetical protein